MNPRGKYLAVALGGLGALLAGLLLLRAFLLVPLQKLDRDIAGLRSKLAAVAKERQDYFAAEKRMREIALRAFDDDVDEASAKSGALLTHKIIECGLREADFTRLPVGPRKLKGASEIGWSVQGEGPLGPVVNLLFLLQTSPYLHRLDGLGLSPGEAPGEVKVRFRFLTLVLQPALPVEPEPQVARLGVDSPERRLLDGIVWRDLLRPYIKRPPAPPASGTPAGPALAPGAPPGPEALRVVDLSDWQGQPEVAVLDEARRRTQRYKPGDALAGGTIVMVDYRPLPLPDKPGLLSHSRVILKVGADYWAVERGRTLAEKYKLSADQLPADLPQR